MNNKKVRREELQKGGLEMKGFFFTKAALVMDDRTTCRAATVKLKEKEGCSQ